MLSSECLTDQVFEIGWAHLYEAGRWVSPLFKVLLSVLLLDLQSKARAKNTLHPQKEHKLLLRLNPLIWTKRDCECAGHVCDQHYRTLDENESDRPLRGFTATHTVRSQTHHKNHHSKNTLPELTKMVLVISGFILKSPVSSKWDHLRSQDKKA